MTNQKLHKLFLQDRFTRFGNVSLVFGVWTRECGGDWMLFLYYNFVLKIY